MNANANNDQETRSGDVARSLIHFFVHLFVYLFPVGWFGSGWLVGFRLDGLFPVCWFGYSFVPSLLYLQMYNVVSKLCIFWSTGALGVGRRTLKNRLIMSDKTRFGTTIPRKYCFPIWHYSMPSLSFALLYNCTARAVIWQNPSAFYVNIVMLPARVASQRVSRCLLPCGV